MAATDLFEESKASFTLKGGKTYKISMEVKGWTEEAIEATGFPPEQFQFASMACLTPAGLCKVRPKTIPIERDGQVVTFTCKVPKLEQSDSNVTFDFILCSKDGVADDGSINADERGLAHGVDGINLEP